MPLKRSIKVSPDKVMLTKQTGRLLERVWGQEQRSPTKRGRTNPSRVPHCTRSIINQWTNSGNLTPSVSLSRNELLKVPIIFSNHTVPFILKQKASTMPTADFLPSRKIQPCSSSLYSHTYLLSFDGSPNGRPRGPVCAWEIKWKELRDLQWINGERGCSRN